MIIRKGDKFLCLEDVKNVFGFPLFKKDDTYTVLYLDDDSVTLDHILYANEYNSFPIEWVLEKFKIKQNA